MTLKEINPSFFTGQRSFFYEDFDQLTLIRLSVINRLNMFVNLKKLAGFPPENVHEQDATH